jgi:vancomycin permeability regulator SanA
MVGNADHPAPADVGVVLATELHLDGTLTKRLQARCDRGYQAYQQHLVPRLLLSGGIDDYGRNEAVHMRDYLASCGVPDSVMTVDSLGVDTWHTAIDTRAYLAARGLSSAMIVTQGFHVPRTRLAFARIGIPRFSWVHARFWEWRDLFSVAREFPALVKYVLRPLPAGTSARPRAGR